ncbi:hypothetical protein F8277_01585 [Bifidobacterium longum subsp. infantis]|nr:hypothetical protein F8277_01585 [Bifidobacterium longum subsp. infantis]MSR95569.1 hypothetical protein [Bifidobacterium sp. WCA-178-WT-4B]
MAFRVSPHFFNCCMSFPCNNTAPKHSQRLQWPRKGGLMPNNAVTLHHTEPTDYPEQGRGTGAAAV